ncbi:Glucosamine-6-phosphate deaminase [Clostridiaceae bacterium JG1575]|nr:Glucosamine-6-phosphate deaminase [Clostridiaceae bacterium JG1575]
MLQFIVMEDAASIARATADRVEAKLRDQKEAVLGLATGSSPILFYEELVRRHREEGLDFSKVHTLNLDEYVGLCKEHPQSYRFFMNHHLFSKINIPMEQTHIPEGSTLDPQAEAARYEALIRSLPPAAVQILGIGTNGHIGFNEPAPVFSLAAHEVALKSATVEANARFFEDPAQVPHSAITMGVGGILRAEQIILLAMGPAKAWALAQLAGAFVDPKIPATILRVHPHVTIFCDEAAAAKLPKECIGRPL